MLSEKKILHISNDYSGSTVYKNLAKELDNLGVKQIIYNPIRDIKLIGKNSIKLNQKNSEIVYSPILNWHIDRLFYPYKIYKIFIDIQKKIDFSKINFIHAHTWYSDGGVAYFLSKKYNIPFIVTIRNTDLNIFQKKLIYLQPFGRKILKNSKQIILISASYKKRILNQLSLRKITNQIKSKIKIIPNGVDQYWIKNSFIKTNKKNDNESHILYVGRFTTGKQIPNLQKAIIQLNKEISHKVILHLVGSDGKDEKNIQSIIKKHPNIFIFHGKINEKDKLLSIFRYCDIFAMPSRNETFGLVYIEAMLQGLPIIYTENEGIDGFYNEKIGEKISKHNIEEIKDKIKNIIINYNSYSIPLEKIKNNHDWNLIAKKYLEIYKKFI